MSTGLAIIKAELKQRRWSTIWWIIGIGVFLTLVLAVYPSFRDQAATFDKTFNNFSDSAKALFTDTADFFSPVGYLSSQAYYLMMPLLFGFLAIGMGASLIAREEQNKTIELLLSRPVARGKLLLAKAGAGTIILFIVGIAMAILGAVEVAIIGFAGVRAIDIFWVTFASLLLSLLFGSVAFLLTAMGRFGRGASIAVATLFALGGYIISSLDQTVKWLQWPAKFFPFHYYHPADIMYGHVTYATMFWFFAISVGLLVLSYIAFRRRDIE